MKGHFTYKSDKNENQGVRKLNATVYKKHTAL